MSADPDRAGAVAEILLDLLEQETAARDLGFEERVEAVTRLCALVVFKYAGLDGSTFTGALQSAVAGQIALVALERREAAAREIGAVEIGASPGESDGAGAYGEEGR